MDACEQSQWLISISYWTLSIMGRHHGKAKQLTCKCCTHCQWVGAIESWLSLPLQIPQQLAGESSGDFVATQGRLKISHGKLTVTTCCGTGTSMMTPMATCIDVHCSGRHTGVEPQTVNFVTHDSSATKSLKVRPFIYVEVKACRDGPEDADGLNLESRQTYQYIWQLKDQPKGKPRHQSSSQLSQRLHQSSQKCSLPRSTRLKSVQPHWRLTRGYKLKNPPDHLGLQNLRMNESTSSLMMKRVMTMEIMPILSIRSQRKKLQNYLEFQIIARETHIRHYLQYRKITFWTSLVKPSFFMISH